MDWQAQQLAPYAEWAQRGLSSDDILMALQTQAAILQDPRGYWESMGRQYGWNSPQAQQAQAFMQQQEQAPQQAQSQNGFDDIFGGMTAEEQQSLPPAVQQQLAAVQQQVAQIQAQQQQVFQQQEQQVAVEQGRARIEREFQAIEQRYGPLDEEVKQEIGRRAVANFHAGIDPSITRAYHEYRDFENRVTTRYARQRPAAPQVLGSGSGMAPPVAPVLDTPEAKQAAAFALALQMGADNPNGGYRA
jgi:hypothetical protein